MLRNVKQDQDGVHEVHCSRERSRAAWKIIEEVLVDETIICFWSLPPEIFGVPHCLVHNLVIFCAVFDALCGERGLSDLK